MPDETKKTGESDPEEDKDSAEDKKEEEDKDSAEDKKEEDD